MPTFIIQDHFNQNRIMKDGTPCAVKVARTVWSGGKAGDYIKGLPIAIITDNDLKIACTLV